MNENVPERLNRWMLYHEQPERLNLDHEAQIDLAWAADEIVRLKGIIDDESILNTLKMAYQCEVQEDMDWFDLEDMLRKQLILLMGEYGFNNFKEGIRHER